MDFSIYEDYASPKIGITSEYDDSKVYDKALKLKMSNKDFIGWFAISDFLLWICPNLLFHNSCQKYRPLWD